MRANLESIGRLADRAEPDLAGRLRGRAATATDIVDRMQTLNRRLLRRIRPMALDHVPLGELLADLVAEFERHAPEHRFTLDAARLTRSYGEGVGLTIYRCAQEALTNAVRHAEARHVAVALSERTQGTSPGLCLVVEDDGVGIAPQAPAGYGLTGIEERIAALGGRWRIGPAPVGGTRVEIEIPAELPPAEATIGKNGKA